MNRDQARNGGSEDQGRLCPVVDLRTTRPVGIAACLAVDSPDLDSPIRTAGDLWHSGVSLRLAIELLDTAPVDHGLGLEQRIHDALEESGLPPSALQLGFRGPALTDPDLATVLERLADRGVTAAVTNFGTGRISIRDLVRLPIASLNLDPSLTDSAAGEDETAIIRASVHLAHQLGMQVLAEGVEHHETWRRLRSLGVDQAQGPLVSPPLTAREVPAWLATWNRRARELGATRRFRPEPTVPA